MYEDPDGTHARDLHAPRRQDRDDGADATYTVQALPDALIPSWHVLDRHGDWAATVGYDTALGWLCSCGQGRGCRHTRAVRAAQRGE